MDVVGCAGGGDGVGESIGSCSILIFFSLFPFSVSTGRLELFALFSNIGCCARSFN